MSDPFYGLRLDPNGVVVGTGFSASGDAQDGMTAVSAEIYNAAQPKVGRCRLVDGALQDYVPPAPTPAASTPNVTGRQIKDQARAGGYSSGLVRFLAKAGQVDAAGKPLGVRDDDYLYWLGIALDTAVPIDNPKVGRILCGGGVVNGDGSSAVPAFMQAALQLPA